MATARHRRVPRVRDRHRHAALVARRLEHGDHVGRGARLRDAEHDRRPRSASARRRPCAATASRARPAGRRGGRARAARSAPRCRTSRARRSPRSAARRRRISAGRGGDRPGRVGQHARDGRGLLGDLGADERVSRRQGRLLRRARARSRGCRRARPRRPARPGARRPRSARRAIRAGTADAAASASSSGTPSACRLRTASIIVSTLPASCPSGPRTDARRRTRAGGRPARTTPSAIAVAATASVTSASRPRAARHATSSASPATCVAVGDDLHGHVGPRRAPRARCPGRAARAGRIALKRCVTVPHAAVEGQVRLRPRRRRCGRRETTTPRSSSRSISSQRAGQLRRERHLAHAARVEQPHEQRRVGRALPLGAGARPGAAGEMNGPSRCAPITQGPPRARPAGISLQRGDELRPRAAVMNVGW